jgi:hypothetical protein
MIRIISRPSTAKCTLPIYVGFLLSEPTMISCCRLSEVESVSHDSVNRFLYRESYEPKDLYNESIKTLNAKGGILSVDDTVLDKPYAKYIAYLGYYWSGKHHRVVKGINVITLFYTDLQGRQQPINFRIYDKNDGKTKNDYFLEMLEEVRAWGLEPGYVTGDSWYSCVKNLKQIKTHLLNFLFGVESNRLVSIKKGEYCQAQALEIPKNGLMVWLKDYGYVKLFRTNLKNQVRYYVMYITNETFESINDHDFNRIHSDHYDIEQYHRTIKQVCNIENFQVRGKTAVKNHIFSALFGFVQLQIMKTKDLIQNCYRLRRNLFNEVISSFINSFIPGLESLNPQYNKVVNA